jgi:hypothetical protein
MKKIVSLICIAILLNFILFPINAEEFKDEVAKKVKRYFKELFTQLKIAADQNPNPQNFRKIMKPIVENIPGFYGATLIDPDFIIRQVYYPSHFLARGYDLKKVKELKYFYKKMKESPSPQLSEPGHGNIFQPRLIAMRYPVIKNGKLKNIVSLMVRTEYFLKYTGLDKCKAFRIICLGKISEKKGKLSKKYKEIRLRLPSTEWIIQYER